MKFKIEECKYGDWQVKEKIVLDIGTFCLLEDVSGFFRWKQIASNDGSIEDSRAYADSFEIYATLSRRIGTEFGQAFSAAYRQRAIDEFRKAFPVAEEYFFRASHKNETKEEAKERIKARYEQTENSPEVAAFACKSMGMNPYNAVLLFGRKFLGRRCVICGTALEDSWADEMDAKQLLDKVWRIMCEMQKAYDKGERDI